MKQPFVTLEQLEEIVRQYPTPFHLYDEKGIRENARKLYQAFAWNPGFKEYFAVKATPNPTILKILREEGCGADCSSLTELMLSHRCGFPGRRSCSPPTTPRRRSSGWPPSWGPPSTWTTSPTSTSSRTPSAISPRPSPAASTPAAPSPWGSPRRASR